VDFAQIFAMVNAGVPAQEPDASKQPNAPPEDRTLPAAADHVS
jgi:hypothetical protein